MKAKNIALTAALGDYDQHRSLILGAVQPAGIDLTVLPMRSQERHWRMMRHREFDIAELSMSSYLIAKSRQLADWIAIPVFPHRRFRHSYIFVNPQRGLRSARDLEGRRIGLRTWQATMGVWVRGILQEHYGVDIRSIEWVTQDREVLDVDFPPDFRICRVPAGTDVDQMLRQGELDGLIYPDLIRSFLDGEPHIARFFPDYKQEEIRYYRQTGHFPIMHTVVIRSEVLEAYPWVAENLLQAFRQSQEDAWRRMEDPRTISLAWVRELIEEERAILGTNPWPIGLEPNRKTLETLMRYSCDQGMIRGMMPVEELFFPATLDRCPAYL